jgi:hypothetical protein
MTVRVREAQDVGFFFRFVRSFPPLPYRDSMLQRRRLWN